MVMASLVLYRVQQHKNKLAMIAGVQPDTCKPPPSLHSASKFYSKRLKEVPLRAV